MKIEDIKKYNWEKYWAGNWSFLTSCYFANYYTHLMQKQMGEKLDKAIIVSSKGYSFCYLDPNDRKKYGEFIGAKIGKNKATALKFGHELKSRADSLVELIHQLSKKKTITELDYTKFVEEFLSYSGPHISVRHTVDLLSAKSLQKVFRVFQDLRLYVEKVYEETEHFMRLWAKQVGKQKKVDSKLVLCCTKEEVDNYWRTGRLPSLKALKDRFKLSSMIFDKTGYQVLTGSKVNTVEKLLQGNIAKKEVKGQVAYPGKVRGHIRIIFDPTPQNSKKFQKGDILVTGMTRPEFLPLMHKSGAVVTDAGGILSHAAITAREIKKPTVIGTLTATKVFKDGDFVEVDAEKGIVKITKLT